MPSAVWQHFERLEREKDDPICRKYLAISASSSPSERLFSKAGQIVSSQRAQLKPEQANMIIFLAENL